MDLDDSFTERLLQRNKVRKVYKTIKENECLDVTPNKRHALVEEQQILNQVGSNGVSEETTKRTYEPETDDSPKRQCLQQHEGSPSKQWPPQQSRSKDGEKENTPIKRSAEESFVPFKASLNVRGLAALRKKDNDSDVISNRLISGAEESDSRTYMFSTNSSDLCSGRKVRLASLTANINQWEDDYHKPPVTTKTVTTHPSRFFDESSSCNFSSNYTSVFSNSAPVSEIQCNLKQKNKSDSVFFNSEKKDSSSLSPSKKSNIENNSVSKISSDKFAMWDQAIKVTLAPVEIKKSPVKTFNALNEKRECIKNGGRTDDCSSNSVKSKLKLFGNQQSTDLNESFDPVKLPVSARKALFERASCADGDKVKEYTFEPKLSVAQRAALFENASQKSSASKPLPSFKSKNACTPPKLATHIPAKIANVDVHSSPLKSLPTSEKTVAQENTLVASPGHTSSPVKKIYTDTRAVEEMLLARVNSKVEIKEPVIKEAEETKSRNLVNYWENLSSSKSGNSNSEEELSDKHEIPESDMYQSEEEQDGYESETESKYERESESEFNYNTEITEEEFSESDHESESPVENVFKSPKGLPPTRNIDASKAFDANVKNSTLKSSAINKVRSWNEDNFIEDTCDATSFTDGSCYAESSTSTDIQPAEYRSYTTSSTSSVGSSFDPESSRESEENFAKSNCGSGSDTNLLYTVSFYRKQKQETRTPPMKTIIRREHVPSSSSDVPTESIQEQIKILQEEITKQQTIIGQTSQALNLCHSTAEFSGSSEQVEGERLLLIATQKRQALLNEIQRLKSHGAEGGTLPDGTGTLTISDLQLPLKQEFMAAQLEGRINDAVHWFLCLIRYGAQVIVTQMVSTDDKVSNGALCFTNHIKLQNLPPDFSIVFEVYALQTKKESLPHEKKYHIKRDKSTMRLMSKGRKSDNKLLIPTISSPGGPNAVRSPSFGVIGFTRFNIQNCNKKSFTLDKVPFTSPLEGVLRVKLHLHAEHKVMEKGFLTMFEDVSGFGAWHRRWCALNAHHLTYWKYPDDEQKKDPIGAIDLKQCVTMEVKPISRDICARPHTFQLVTVRPQAKGDKNSLISQCANTLTTTKHLLSADTKEERILWCDKLNEALTNIRKWVPQSKRPLETNM